MHFITFSPENSKSKDYCKNSIKSHPENMFIFIFICPTTPCRKLENLNSPLRYLLHHAILLRGKNMTTEYWPDLAALAAVVPAADV